MTFITRREFIQKMTLFGTVLYGRPLRRMFESREPNASRLDSAAIRKLASELTGHIITTDAPDYDAARLIFNRAFDLHPSIIVRCGGASDVVRSLEFAQKQNLQLAVRGGGHSRLGYGMCDGGVVIDLSGLKRVDVDTSHRVAHVEAGTLVRDLDEATQHFGLATTSGGCPTVGVAGLTLGGGEGRLDSKYGLACDNLLSAQLVTVDGRRIEVSENSNSDLFWAIRGGGGNFGVLTELEYQLHPVGQVLSGALSYPVGRIPELLQAFVRFIAGAPDEMSAFVQLSRPQQGPRFKIDVCYCGDPHVGNDLVRPLRALKPQDDQIKTMSYLEAQAAGGFLLAPVAHFQTDLFLPELSEAAIAAISTAVENAPPRGKVIIVTLRGAVSRVRSSDTAFALRQPGYEVDIAAAWSAPAEKPDAVRWVVATRGRLQPFSHGVYINQLGDTSEALVRAGYGSNYDRLVAIKKKYDPNNILRLNQNIKPDRTT